MCTICRDDIDINCLQIEETTHFDTDWADIMQIPNEADICRMVEENLILAREQISMISDPAEKAEAELELAKAAENYPI